VFRLATLLPAIVNLELSVDLQQDMNSFCKYIAYSLPEAAFFKTFGVQVEPKDVFATLCVVFNVNNNNTTKQL